MGLFGLFKKKETKKDKATEDFNPLDIESVIRYIKRTKPGISDKEAYRLFSEIAKPSKDLEHLTSDGELPYGWYSANKDFIKITEDEYLRISNVYYNSKNKSVSIKYNALKALVVYMSDIQRICKTKGECFQKWSEVVVANPESLNEWKGELEYMEEHMDELLQEEKMIKKLKSDLKKIIKSEPGVKQEQLYKRFSPDMKHHISNELYKMGANGVITREKSGRSYALYINEK